MTTKVTVDAHAGWPVEVTRVQLDAEGKPAGEPVDVVPAKTTRDLYVHSLLELRVKELPL